jgi:predicted PurR-regulated permease PerM
VAPLAAPDDPAAEAPPAVAEWSDATRRLALVLVLGLGLGLAWLSVTVLHTLIVAVILAFLVRPLSVRLERRGLGHTASVLWVYLGVALVLGLSAILLVPRLLHEGERAGSVVLQFLERAPRELASWLAPYRRLALGDFVVDLSPLVDRLTAAVAAGQGPSSFEGLDNLVGPVQQVLAAASTLFIGAASMLLNAVLAFAISLYLSIEAPRLLADLDAFAGKAQSVESRELLRRVSLAWTDFLRGQAVLMVVIGTVVTLGGLALGLPGAVALGLLAGVLEVLPNIGPILATVPAVIVALVAGSTWLPVSNVVFALIVVAFYIVVQQLENNLIVPRVIGQAVALPSVVIMIAVIIGAEVGGILGAFIAAPVAATLREVVAYTLDKVRGIDPYPELRGTIGGAGPPATAA